MNITAIKLRKLVKDNALTLGRLSKEQLGDDYATMTALYTTTLDALTEWASKDYAHKSTEVEEQACFDAVRAILSMYETKDDRIVINATAMRTMRDCATKPKRLYSDAYKKAEKSRKEQAKTVAERYDDLMTLGCAERAEDETVVDYVARIRETGINVMSHKVDMLSMYEAAIATLAIKEKKVEDIKAAGNWTWRRPVAVSLPEFADLIENYVADCLMDGYNIKPTKVIREEAKAAREAKANAKTNKKAA